MNIKPWLRTRTSKLSQFQLNPSFQVRVTASVNSLFELPTVARNRIQRHRKTFPADRVVLAEPVTFYWSAKVCCQSLSGETMAVAERRDSDSEGVKRWGLCPFWQSGTPSSSTQNIQSQSQIHQNGVELEGRPPCKVTSVAKSFLPTRRRLRLDPANTLYFPYEPGKQVRSAVRIKNRSRSHIAFKFQTTAPKSCYMRPPGGILAPGESIIATEQPEDKIKQVDKKSKVKFKIMSLKVKAGIDYVPELFDEQKDQVVVEKILRVVFLDAEWPTPALEKLKLQLAEADAEAAVETRKKPAADTGSRVVGEGLVIDEWKERREKYLARQQVEAVDSVR